MKNYITIIGVFFLFIGCSPNYNYQSNIIKEYEQVWDGVKTDLKMKILEIDRIGTKPLDSLYYRKSEFKQLIKIIEDNNLENAQFPIFKVSYRIFNPLLQVNQEITKFYAFDPNMTMIVTTWK
jgi:hypothetical protein